MLPHPTPPPPPPPLCVLVPLAPPPRDGVGITADVVALRLKRAEEDGEPVEKGVVLPPPSVEGEEEGQKVGVALPELLAAASPFPPLGVGEEVKSAGERVWRALGEFIN